MIYIVAEMSQVNIGRHCYNQEKPQLIQRNINIWKNHNRFSEIIKYLEKAQQIQKNYK